MLHRLYRLSSSGQLAMGMAHQILHLSNSGHHSSHGRNALIQHRCLITAVMEDSSGKAGSGS